MERKRGIPVRSSERKRRRRLSAPAVVAAVILLCAAVYGAFRLSDAIGDRIERNLYPCHFSEQVEAAAAEFGVPEDVIYAVIRTESNFRQDAVSHAGARGLMQLMPDTYTWIAWRLGEDAEEGEICEPVRNIRYGTYLLSYLYGEFGRWETAYAAYNAGASRVRKWLDDPEIAGDGVLRNIPIRETADYVKKVAGAREHYAGLLAAKR